MTSSNGFHSLIQGKELYSIEIPSLGISPPYHTAMRSLCTATKSSPHSPQLEKAHAQQQRPNTAKN